MPINLTPFQLNGLAAAAQNTTPNLGLKPWGIDPEIILKKQELEQQKVRDQLTAQYQQASLKNQLEIQELQNKGFLKNTEVKAVLEARQSHLNNLFTAKQNELDRGIELQKLSALQQYQQANLGLQEKQLNAQTEYQQGQLGLQGQQLQANRENNQAQLGLQEKQLKANTEYQQGQLGLQEKQFSADNYFKMVEHAATMKEKAFNKEATLLAGASSIFALHPDDPEKATGIVKDLVNRFDVPDDVKKYFNGLDANSMQNAVGVSLTAMMQGKKLKDGAAAQGQQIYLKEDGTPGFRQAPITTELDKQLAKTQAQDYSTAMAQYNAVPGAIEQFNNVIDLVNKTDASAFGTKNTQIPSAQKPANIQSIESITKRMVYTYKNAEKLGSQGFTDSDRKFVEAITGSTANSKGALLEILQRNKGFTQHIEAASWYQAYNIIKNSNQKDQWLADNPEPTLNIAAINPQTGQKEIQTIQARDYYSHWKTLNTKGWKLSDSEGNF